MKKKTFTGLLVVSLLTIGTIIGMTGCAQSDTKTSDSEAVQVEQSAEADSQLSQNSSSEPTEVDTSSAENEINNCMTDAEALMSEIGQTTLAGTQEERRSQYNTLEQKIDDIENRLERIEDTWEDDYHAGKVSQSSYRSIENKVEEVEDYLDKLDDALENQFNYEFND